MDIMEAVEIKSEPLDEEFSQIIPEEISIKTEKELDWTTPIENICIKSEVQISETWLSPNEEPSIYSDEPLKPDPSPIESTSPKGINSNENSNKCNFCDMFFKSGTLLKLHERNCQFKNDCKLCGQTFVTSYALITHLYKFHNQFTENVSPQKDQTKSASLGRSQNVNLKNLDYHCDICNLKFANSRHLNNHKKKHLTCQQCGENLKSYEALETHRCDNIVVKEEDESESELPTKKKFHATNNMVIIPDQNIHTHDVNNIEVQNAKPKKRKCKDLFQENSSISPYQQNSGPKSGFAVVTKDTDFETFAKHMMKGLTSISEPCEDIKMNEMSELVEHMENNSESDTNQADNFIVDSEGNVYKICKENFVSPSKLIKEEPLDENQLSNQKNLEPCKPELPVPLSLIIKDEPTDQPNTTDSTDILLEELFDRKAKAIARVRQSKLPFNPSFTQNSSELNATKKINSEGPIISENKTPTSNNLPSIKLPIIKRKRSCENKQSTENELQPKALPTELKVSGNNNYKANTTKNITLPTNKSMDKLDCNSKKLPTLKNISSDKLNSNSKKLPTLKNISSDEKFSKTKAIKPVHRRTTGVSENSCTSEDADCKGNDEGVFDKMSEAEGFAKAVELDAPLQKPNSDLPSEGESITQFDFEEAIQSNTLPNFNKFKTVIKNLTEEYKKAEKIKLKEAPAFVEVVNPTKPELKKNVDENNKPNSLFFPMLEDSQVYNMVASALHEKYRYVWICPMCPRQYNQLRPFKKHLLSTHFEGNELEGKSFELRPELVFESGSNENFCHLCNVNLADNATLRKHQFDVHKDQDLTLQKNKKKVQHRCYICNKRCSSRSLLAEHMKSDCGKNPQYTCNVCDKKFHTQSTLNLHKTMHTGELPHSCGYCQKRFRTRGQLTVHTRTHTGEKPFPCKVCDQSFTHRETLIAHLSRHIDMKRYKCYGCGQLFTCISGLKTHRSVRPDTCGRVELDARAVGPRVRVIKGNVIFEPQPVYNPRLAVKIDKPLDAYALDHNYSRKKENEAKNDSQQKVQKENIIE